ncbi:hypothetical protein IFT48_03510 [Pseudomonas fluorescens]|uniref:hypothetical protein n=1 Tax=Pseudomonas fluorescens TaxID=294 RepID=UPI001930B28B|nr:hypothetical protein [Pseudomonas fluorescens]MBD8089037.1 hypothetical protein [Pseudomonas fluorescens]
MTDGLSVDEAEIIAQDFYEEYPALKSIPCHIRYSEEEAYGHEYARKSKEAGYRTSGAYYPKRAAIRIASSSNRTEEDLRRTLRHELLGHYGLNCFKPQEKRSILDSLLRFKESGQSADNWAYLSKMYPGAPSHLLAEEFFAHLCEHNARPDVLITPTALQQILSSKDHLPSSAEIIGLANLIAEKAADNDLVQQTFPSKDNESFKTTYHLDWIKAAKDLERGVFEVVPKRKGSDNSIDPEP